MADDNDDDIDINPDLDEQISRAVRETEEPQRDEHGLSGAEQDGEDPLFPIRKLEKEEEEEGGDVQVDLQVVSPPPPLTQPPSDC